MKTRETLHGYWRNAVSDRSPAVPESTPIYPGIPLRDSLHFLAAPSDCNATRADTLSALGPRLWRGARRDAHGHHTSMWNQDWFKEDDYDADDLGRFPQGVGFPGAQSADWGWAQHMLASLAENGRAAIVIDTAG